MRRLAAILILLAVTMVLAVPVGILTTEKGLRWVYALIEDRLPISLEGLRGTVRGGIRAERLVYAGSDVRLEVIDAAMAVELRCALGLRLCVSSLEAGELRLDLPEASGSGGGDPLAFFAALPAIEVEALRLGRLALRRGDTATVFEDIDLAGRIDATALDIDRLRACHEFACAELGLGLDAGGQWQVQGDVERAPTASMPAALELPRRLRVAASGDLASARLRVADLERGDTVLSARLEFEGDDLSGSATLSGLTALLPVLEETSPYPLQGDLSVDFEGPTTGWRLALQQGLRMPDEAILPLRARIVQEGDGWRLAAATLGDAAAPRLQLSGAWSGPGEALRADATLDAFDLPRDIGLDSATLDGRLQINLLPQTPVDSWALTVDDLVLHEASRRWRASGQLQADGQRLPLGQLDVVLGDPATGDGPSLAASYARRPSARRAELVTTEPLRIGDLSLGRIAVAVAPDGREWRLVSDGDLATELDLRIDTDDTGLRLRLAPFEIAYAGERLHSNATTQLLWRRDAGALALGAFCLRWRSSRLCSDGSRLEADGNMNLHLELDERLEERLADKPFALAAQGQGDLSLAWQDWQPQVGRLDLALDNLSVDPFVASRTANPLRWERVDIEGRLTVQEAHLEARLASRELGDLTASVTTRGDELSGFLRGVALSVAPLADLVPEWTVDAGRLDIDLAVAGSPAEPRITGRAALSEAALFLPSIDTRLDDVSLDARLEGQDATLEGTATLGGGTLRLEARCCSDEQATGLLIGERNRLTLPNGLDAVISPSLDLRLTPQQLAATGSLVIHDGVFEHSGLEEGGVGLSPDFRRVDVPQARPRRFALNLDLRTLIQPGFTLRSERLEATLGGDLRFVMRSGAPPSLFGNLDVRGGELRAYGQALRLTDGALGFVGDPLNPDLAINAERDIRSENQRVGFRVRGSLEAPRFELFSDPPRPDNETLSYLIRGRGPDVGASADGTAMALSLGATALNQSGVLAPLNSIPGLSGVTLGAEGTDQDMAATISAYVGNRLYLSYGVGIYEPINALTARLYLRSRLWLEVVSRLESSFDLYYRFDRD